MSTPEPADVIAQLAASYRDLSDEQILERITALPPLADESDPIWDSEEYWVAAAYPYLALRGIAGDRKLRPAARLLLERASFGDPGEIMRGLRHPLERMYADNISALADEYLAMARSDRPGTRLWAISGLMVLDDPRAREVFEHSIRTDPPMIREVAEIGLERLVNPGKLEQEHRQWQEQLARSEQERLAKQAESDAAITDRRCGACGKPMPSYRKTCKHCKAPADARA